MRAGYVTIIGLPNVGKSTLLNRLLDVKLSIVSKKPQTTRNKILGILTEGENQAVFIDTPGIVIPKYGLHIAMLRQIKDALSDADVVIWLTDMNASTAENGMVKKLIPDCLCLPVINKIDLVERKDLLLPLIERYHQTGFEEIFLISALSGEGVNDLKQTIFDKMPEGFFFYPKDQLTDHPERFFAGELIREQIFELYGEELPYASFVTIEEFKEREKGKYYLRAVIYVERDSQKSIVIGRQGRALKQLGIKARKAIEDFLEHEVFLDLWVKVKKNWRKNRHILNMIEYGNV